MIENTRNVKKKLLTEMTVTITWCLLIKGTLFRCTKNVYIDEDLY